MTKQLADTLREHKVRSRFSLPGHFVFASTTGTPMQGRNVVRRGLDKALERAGLAHVRFHDLRHTAASLMSATYPDVVFVSRQLGHANAAITLSMYAHLFDKAQHAEEMRSRLEASHGTTLETAAGEWWRTDEGEQLALDSENVTVLPVRGAVANGG